MAESETGRMIDNFGAAVAESITSFLPARIDVDAQLPMHPLRTVQKLDLGEFLSVLNFEDESREELWGRLNRISETLPPEKPKSHWAARMANQARKKPEVSVDDGQRTFDLGRRLRRWVDEWLDSGREANGVECPASRSYERANAVSAAVYKYSTRGKMHLLGTKDGLQLWFDLEAEKTPPAAGFALELFIETVASEKLVLFLLSGLSYKLGKCRDPDCGRYFVLKHWTRPYKSGPRCDECQRARSLKSAKAATADDRDRAEGKLHSLAATHFGEQIRGDSDWHKNPKLKDQIAHYLSRKIERSADLLKVYPAGVTRKWVTRADNWKAIQTVAKKGAAQHVSLSL